MTLPLADLVQQSAEEVRKFTQKRPNDPSVILALFYRACYSQNDADRAWEALYQQYSPLVLSWIARYHGSHLTLLLHEEAAWSLVNAAWEKFVRSVAHKIQHFTRLPQLLSYFERCTHSILADRVRICLSTQNQRQGVALSWEDLCETTLEPHSEEVGEAVEHQLFAEHLWTVVDDCLHDDERILLHLTFEKQMRPLEICHDYPSLYASVDDVYRIKRNATARLSRSPRLKGLLADYDALPRFSPGKKERQNEAS